MKSLWLALYAQRFLFFIFWQIFPQTYWNICNNVSQWWRYIFLLLSKSRSQRNKMISHEIHDTVVFYSKKSFKNVLSSLHISHSRHKVTIADCRNVLKYLPHSQGLKETCLTVISSANKMYCAKINAIKHHDWDFTFYVFVPTWYVIFERKTIHSTKWP